ncbi:ErfK/YbiS/YcfS/YnhG family protein [Solidesulfovibrio fructosivorans JJ]]|uniref:ErfK/YbiS/YcfS/YnhG family protein n=1 Tax=Solidesulfovibrio fructosivorans JJ] TaxID=596151 RepID=E1JVA5_SOLFR|nr:L,D-transpeptidase family protein [Solidesulfovibrio fructosivorans]EFL51699.1 ErfK/YbiS/YcfS/YnhG family protein [Solidesulfovibrio fructosivorans JJ]]
MKRIGPIIAAACLVLVCGSRASGEWTADIVDMDSTPSRFVAVDKKAQSFALLSRHSPLRVLTEIPCATGQALGDKFKEGDLKTPEGVYFITRRKSSGLNFDLYGDLAFPLDFPNPADVLRHKSGHGIWIHGRGHPITPYETQGCVALSMANIHRVDPELAEGMPVVIADQVRLGGKDSAALREEAKEVVADTYAWAKAWQNKSPAFFDFHDPEKFSITEGKPFSAFRGHKERLFKVLPWIKVDLADVRALAGPDYWVTYFVQLYRSPTLTSQGVKRLYWQRGTDGRFRIIGMEYEEMPVTLASAKTAGKPASPDEADTDTRKPDSPSEEEVQVRQLVDAHQAIMEKMARKAFGSLSLAPQHTPEDEAILEVAKSGEGTPGVSVATDAMRQVPPAPAAIAQAPAQPAPATPVKPAPAPAAGPTPPAPVTVAVATPAPSPAKVRPEAVSDAASGPWAPAPAATQAGPAPLDAGQTARVAAMVAGWSKAWENADMDGYLGYYADGARLGNLRGKDAIRRQKEGVWRGAKPERVDMRIVAAGKVSDGFDVVCAQVYQAKGRRESKGFKSLTLVPSGDRLLISAERWSKNRPEAPNAAPVTVAATPQAPAPGAPRAATATKVQAPEKATEKEREAAVAAMVESWRKAWESGRLDAYSDFYAENAVQGDRRSRQAIREDKADLWKDKAPSKVDLSDVRIRPRKDGFVVTCVQDYASKDGGGDHGRKTLYIEPSGNGYAIVEEQWSRM